ncbi:unnamed protein product [Alopecurus aequalis]
MSDDIRAARQCKQELAIARGLQDPKNLLPVQILVLLSLGQQVILFLCAGVRRSETSRCRPVRVLLLWLAYNFGDTFATYTLAHLSFFTVVGDHPLVTLWAPFLLLHLAGPDNIAAYALQDNQLWLRSLQKVFAQVTAAGYFLYTCRNSSDNLLGIASGLMFVVGVFKYWERWLALQRGNLGSISDSLRKKLVPASMNSHAVHPQDVKLKEIDKGVKTLDEESSVRRAHSLFHICKCGMVDSSEDEAGRQNIEAKMEGVEFWTIIEIELSLIIAKLVGFEELWNRKHFSGAINISDHVPTIKVCINKHIDLLYRKRWLNTLGTVKHGWGMATLKHRDQVYNFGETLGDEFQEGIIIWHIGTDFFLSKCKSANTSLGLGNAIKALSNYMMFLLVERPYMLPGIAQNRLYQRICKALDQGVSHCDPTSTCDVLKSFFRWRDYPASYTSMSTHSRTHAENLYNEYELHQTFSYETVRLTYSASVARELLEYEKEHGTTESLQLLLEVWTDMLVYAGNKGSRESHAKKLSRGGELTTIVWLMVEHMHQRALDYDVNDASAKEASSKEP